MAKEEKRVLELDKYEHDKWDIKTIWGVGYRFEVKP